MLPGDPLQIPGWTVINDDGLLVATRITPLTEYARLHGAVGEVTARDEGELWILCDAHQRFSERLATAEAVRRQVTPFRAEQSP